MISTSKVFMADISQQKRFETDLQSDLTPEHTVEQAIEMFRNHHDIPGGSKRYMAFSRGRRLDAKSRLGDLPEEDGAMTVLTEVSAGAPGA